MNLQPKLFDAREIKKDDRVLLRFTGELLPQKLSGSWATVDRGPIPGSWRIRVRADSETDYPRKIEITEISEVMRDGHVIAKRVQRPGLQSGGLFFPLEHTS